MDILLQSLLHKFAGIWTSKKQCKKKKKRRKENDRTLTFAKTIFQHSPTTLSGSSAYFKQLLLSDEPKVKLMRSLLESWLIKIIAQTTRNHIALKKKCNRMSFLTYVRFRNLIFRKQDYRKNVFTLNVTSWNFNNIQTN